MATQQLTIPVVDLNGKNLGESEVPKDVFGIAPNEDAVHFVCEGQRFRFYKKTASTKGRSLVNGGGKKARKQKGSGMARQGGTRAPHWVGGGVAFGPKAIKRDFKINRKLYRLALASVLADRYSGGQIRLLDYSKLSAPKSQVLSAFISSLSLSQARVGFVVSASEDKNLSKSVRNLRNVDLLSEEKWTTLDFVKTDSLVFSKKALTELLKRMERQA